MPKQVGKCRKSEKIKTRIGKGRERAKIRIVFPFRSVPTRREIQNSKKREKNKKMPLWLHFKPKLEGKGQLKRENKNYRSVPYQPDA